MSDAEALHERRVSEASVSIVDGVTGGVASRLVVGARVVPLGRDVGDDSMARLQASVLRATRGAADALASAFDALRTERAIRMEDGFTKALAATAFPPSDGKVRFTSLSVETDSVETANEFARRTVRETIAAVRHDSARLNGLGKFYDGATVSALGGDEPAREADEARFFSLARRLVHVGLLASVALTIASPASADWRQPSNGAAPVRNAAPQAVAAPPAAVPRRPSPQVQAPVNVLRPLPPPALGARPATGHLDGRGGREGHEARGGGGGAFVGGLVAGAVVGSLGVGIYPPGPYYGPGPGPLLGPGTSGPGFEEGPIPPDRNVVLAAKAVVAVALGNALEGDRQVDRAMGAARQCVLLTNGTRPCEVRLPGVHMDFARSFYAVEALGVPVARQVGRQVTINEAGLDEAIRQAGLTGSEEDYAHGPGY